MSNGIQYGGRAMDERLSRTFNLLRFPLAVWVVLIHSGWSEVNIGGEVFASESLPVFKALSHLVCVGMGGCVVPTFLFISGYLFFRNGSFSWAGYRGKLQRRWHSLVIPYLVWNALTLLFLFAYQGVLAKLGYHFGQTPVSEYRWMEYVRCFWDVKSGAPINFQLWYVRDLILLSVLSPLLWLFLGKMKQMAATVFLLMAYAIYLSVWPPSPPMWSAVFYFVMGGYFSIYRIKIFDGFASPASRLLLSYPVILVILLIFFNENMTLWMASWPIGVLFLINVSYALPCAKRSLSPGVLKLAGMSFFLYCIHEPLLTLLRKVSYLLVRPEGDVVFLSIWLADAIILVSFVLLLGSFIQKKLPRVFKILNGR